MKKTAQFVIAISLILSSAIIYAAQTVTLSNRQVRDPKQLEIILENNATDAETRLAAQEAGTGTSLAAAKLFVGNTAGVSTPMAVIGDTITSQDGTNVTTAIATNVIINADVNASAAIAYSKLNLATSVAPTDAAEGIVVSPTGYSGTGVKLQYGTVPTNATGTITFADVFTAIPAVIIGPEAAAGTTNWYVSSLTTSNFVYTKTADVLGGYIAVGLR